MRILVLTSSFLPVVGGLEMAVHNLSLHWTKLGHEVTVVNVLSDSPSHPEASYKVRRIIPLRGGDRFGWHRFPWNRWMEIQTIRAIQDIKPDLISAHFAYPCGVWLGHISPKIPWSITCHAADIQIQKDYGYGYRLKFDIDRELSRTLTKASRVIVLSENIKRIVNELGVASSSIIKIPNGADTFLRDQLSPIDIRSLMNIPASASYILSVGKNYYAKGFEVSLAAFSKVAQSFPNTYYLYIGEGTDNLKQFARGYGVADLIRTCEKLTGPDLWGAYQQAVLYLSPSRIEGFPCVGAEAVMAGLPLLMTDCPGNREVVKQEINGLLCPVDDIEEMARLLNLMLSNADLLKKLAQGSREQAHRYDWREIAKSYIKAMEVYLNDSPGKN